MSKTIATKATGKESGRIYEPIVRIATIGSTKPGDQRPGILKHRLLQITDLNRSVTPEKFERTDSSEKYVKLETTDSSEKSHSILKPLTQLKGKRSSFQANTAPAVQKEDKPMERRLHFDFVGGASDPRTRAELSILMDTLLGRCDDCCLLHINNLRRCQKHFLHNLLVTEVERRLQLVQSKVLSIELGYYDVRKHENFNVFAALEKVSHKFRTLQQLLKWLRVEYTQLWSSCRWHEFFKFKFNFLDAQQREHHTKFDFIQIYLAKMDRNTKWHLCQLVRNDANVDQVRKGKKTGGYGLLTEDLRKYFDGTEAWCTSIVFDVSHSGGKITNTMLELANSSYDGLKAVKRKVEEDYLTKLTEQVKQDSSQESFLSAAGTSVHTSTSKQSTDRTSDEITEAWIVEIDEKFANVFTSWRDYYDCKHDDKIYKVCKDIKDMSATVEKNKAAVASTSSRHNANNVESLYSNYKQAQAQLRQLMQEVDAHAKGDALRPYMAAKAQELHQVTTEHKVTQLKLCKARLVSVIKDEISSLEL